MMDINSPIEAVHSDGRVSGIAVNSTTRNGTRFDMDATVYADSYRSVWNDTGKDLRSSSDWTIRNAA